MKRHLPKYVTVDYVRKTPLTEEELNKLADLWFYDAMSGCKGEDFKELGAVLMEKDGAARIH